MERIKGGNKIKIEDLDSDPLETDLVGLSRRHSINSYYIRQANNFPFLVRIQEQMIYKFKEKNPHSIEILDDPKFTSLFPEEDKELVKNLQYEAKNPIHIAQLCNMKLVASIAQKYLGQGMDLDDLCTEGQFGLIRSLHKFDYRKGLRISTYATYWIRQSIMRGLAERGKPIRVPEHTVDQLKVIYKLSRGLEQELGRQPTIAELADSMKLTEERVIEIIKFTEDPVSLNTLINDEEGLELSDAVPDESQIPTELLVENKSQRAEIRMLLSILDERERDVLSLRFGLIDGRQRTLEEVGKAFHLTRERIRQIEGKGLRKLKDRLLELGVEKLEDFIQV